jgi:hypothetical protein
LVAIDLDELRHKPMPARSPRELAAEQQRSAGHRSDYECERERADLLVRAQEILDIQLKNLRLLLQAERPAAAPRTLREWWRRLRRTG